MPSSYREGVNEAKAKRLGIVDQRPQPNRNRKVKPVVVEFRLNRAQKDWMRALCLNDWHKWHSYRTKAEAEKAIADQARKHPDLWEFRIKE